MGTRILFELLCKSPPLLPSRVAGFFGCERLVRRCGCCHSASAADMFSSPLMSRCCFSGRRLVEDDVELASRRLFLMLVAGPLPLSTCLGVRGARCNRRRLDQIVAALRRLSFKPTRRVPGQKKPTTPSTFSSTSPPMWSAYVSNNPVPVGELPALIGQVHAALKGRPAPVFPQKNRRFSSLPYQKVSDSGLHHLP